MSIASTAAVSSTAAKQEVLQPSSVASISAMIRPITATCLSSPLVAAIPKRTVAEVQDAIHETELELETLKTELVSLLAERHQCVLCGDDDVSGVEGHACGRDHFTCDQCFIAAVQSISTSDGEAGVSSADIVCGMCGELIAPDTVLQRIQSSPAVTHHYQALLKTFEKQRAAHARAEKVRAMLAKSNVRQSAASKEHGRI